MFVRPLTTRLWTGSVVRSAMIALATGFASLAASAAAAPLAATSAPVVEADTGDMLQFSVSVPPVAWRQTGTAAQAEPGWQAAIAGFTNEGLPGQVSAPRRGGWLIVPPGTRARLEVVNEAWEPAPSHPLALEPVPMLRGDPLSEDVYASQYVPGVGEPVDPTTLPATVQADLALAAKSAPATGPAVTLGDGGYWRGHRLVSYLIQPVQADASGHATRVLTHGTWRVRFVADPQGEKAALPEPVARKLASRGDDRFDYLFLNGNKLGSWPTEAAARGVGRKMAPAGLGEHRGKAIGTPLGYPEVRIPASRTQLYRVRASELRSRGLLPNATIQESQIRLYQRRYVADLDDPANDTAAPYVEVEVPIQMIGGGGAFEGDDFFVFWGLRLRDDGPFSTTVDGVTYDLGDCGDRQEANNDFNVYWLQLAEPESGQTWARMATSGLPASGGNPLPSYRRVDFLKEAVAYRENILDITGDRVYYNSYLQPSADVNLTLWSPVVGQANPQITVGVGSFGAINRTVALTLGGANGTYDLPQHTFNSWNVVPFTTTIPDAALTESALTLHMTLPAVPTRVLSFLAYVRLDYDAAYAAPAGRLLFNGGQVHAVNDVEITGFATDNISLYDLTDPRQPHAVGLTRSNLLADGDLTKLSLQIDQSAGQRTYYVASNLTSGGVADIRYTDAVRVEDPVIPTQLVDGSADALVVIHPAFREAAQRWIDHRHARAGADGLGLQVVAPQDLYDWYSGGLKSAWAIKRFANHALQSPTWGTYALMLIGDGNENARELGVTASGRDYSTDYVPTHEHVQNAGGSYNPEVLGSDKWYAYPAADETNDTDYPQYIVTTPWELYVGRFPCNSVDELNRMIDKTIQEETSVPGETWRQRGIFFADDCFSLGSYDIEGYQEGYRTDELGFEISERDSLARDWRENGGLVPLAADTVMLRAFMQDIYPIPWNSGTYFWSTGIDHCEQTAVAPLKAHLNQGGLVAHYQGHGNMFLMAHENWFKDDRRVASNDMRADVDDLTNVGKPWMYFGMGCHLSDFLQYTVDTSGASKRASLGEKLLGWTAAGAYATYGSTGYEYLLPNSALSNIMFRRWMYEPPAVSVGGEPVASRWVLGELLWASEADCLANNQSQNRRTMVAQYVLLGDPLMVLDCGPPVVDATLDGNPVQDVTDLEAVDATNVRAMQLEARDEAGIAGVQVLDSTGADLTEATVTQLTPQQPNRQIVSYAVALPVRPFDHQLFVHVRDTSDRTPTDEHVIYTFNVHQTAEFVAVASGEVIDPATFLFAPQEPVDITATVTTAAQITDQNVVTVTGDGLLLSNVQVQVGKSTELTLAFTAEAVPNHTGSRSVIVSIDGFPTSYVLEASGGGGGQVTISDLINYPNPMRDATSILFRTNLGGGQGRLDVYTVSGRHVADLPFAVGNASEVVVAWDGRDREGDRLANGVYLYRVQVDGAAGSARSGMQRMVVMR